MWFAATYVGLPDCATTSADEGDMLLWWSGFSCSEPGAEIELEAWRLALLVGRGAFRAFRYSPQALQMVEPVGDRRHSGVWVVPQLLYILSATVFWMHLRYANMTGLRADLAHCWRVVQGSILRLGCWIL